MGPVLIVAPFGADAENTARFLGQAEIASRICRDVGVAARSIETDSSVLLLTEEATVSAHLPRLREALQRQPAWSDLPIVLITSARAQRPPFDSETLRALGSPSSAVVLERPVQRSTLIAAVRAALAARARQFQVRDLLAERERLLGSLEVEVAKRTAELRRTVAELEDFSYSVSHDLRAPLRALYGYARALNEDYREKLDENARHYLERIAVAAERMDRLTQDLLAYTRVSRGPIELEPVDLDTVVADVLEHYPTLTPFRGNIRLRSPLGRVMGHIPSLVQCFSNLLENAVKFARPRAMLRVNISSRVRGDKICVSVRDNGRGISPDQQARIFGLFERAAPNDIDGTGIGLAIVKKAAERMHGRVGVRSKANRGACFWVELPAARRPEGETG